MKIPAVFPKAGDNISTDKKSNAAEANVNPYSTEVAKLLISAR